LAFSGAGPALAAGEFRFAVGPAQYQFEGAGPNSLYIWESKPAYGGVPYAELSWEKGLPDGKRYRRLALDYLGGQTAPEPAQQARREIETAMIFAALGWSEMGLRFEWGGVGVWQRHRVEAGDGGERLTLAYTRLGTFFKTSLGRARGAWSGALSGTMGVLGFPSRQSAVALVDAGVERRLGATPWSVGVKAKMGLLQLERHSSEIRTLGGNGVLVRFRQGETDVKVMMLTMARRI